MLRIKRDIRRGCLLLLVSLVAACGLRDGEGDAAGEPFACGSDAQCPPGERCEAELGACFSVEPAGPRRVALALTPPPGSPYTMTQYAEWEVSDLGGMATLQLPQPSLIYGWVRPRGNELEASVAATVTARAPGHIAGTEYQFSTSTQDPSTVASGAGYELRLAPTEAPYRITVVLDNEHYPAYRLAPRRFGQSAERFDVEIPAFPDDYLVATGRVLYLSGGQPTPLANVAVSATGLSSGNLGQGGVTDGEGGFSLLLPPGDEELWALTVSPVSDGERAIPLGALLQRQDEDGLLSYSESARLGAGGSFGDLWFGELPARAEALIRVLDAEGEAVAGAEVQCRGWIERGESPDGGDVAPALLHAGARAGADGSVALEVRRGWYECDALPPMGAEQGAARATFEASQSSERWEMSLPELVRISGVVTDHGGTRVVPDASVILVREQGGDSVPGLRREGAADDSGRYVLWAEPGVYTLNVVAPKRFRLPLLAREAFRVDGATEANLALDPPMWVRGRVVGDDGEGLEGVRVDLHTLSETEIGASSGSDLAPRILATAVTDEDGRYDLVLSRF